MDFCLLPKIEFTKMTQGGSLFSVELGGLWEVGLHGASWASHWRLLTPHALACITTLCSFLPGTSSIYSREYKSDWAIYRDPASLQEWDCPPMYFVAMKCLWPNAPLVFHYCIRFLVCRGTESGASPSPAGTLVDLDKDYSSAGKKWGCREVSLWDATLHVDVVACRRP